MPRSDTSSSATKVVEKVRLAARSSPRATSRAISLDETLPILKLDNANHDGIAEINNHSP